MHQTWYKFRAVFHERSEVAHSNHQQAARAQEIVEVAQSRLYLIVFDEMGQGIAFADDRIEGAFDHLGQVEEVAAHKVNLLAYFVLLGDLNSFAQHGGAGVGGDDLEIELGKGYGLRSRAAGSIEHARDALVAED